MHMERFVQLVVVGLALLAGLWLLELFGWRSSVWLAGAGLAVLGP